MFLLVVDRRNREASSNGFLQVAWLRHRRTDFTNDHGSLEVENNGGCVTSVERLLEAVVADESRRTVVAFAISRSIIEAQGGTLEAIRREGGVTCVRIELPRVNSP